MAVLLKLNILGRFEARLPSGEIVSLPTRKTEVLLAYLALVPGPHSRDHLSNLLWSDRSEQQARNSLRQALNALKKLFHTINPQPLKIENTNVDMAPNSVDIDTFKLEALIEEQTPRAAAQAIKLYRGEFLEGVVVRDLNGEEWLAAERVRFRRLATLALGNVLVFQLESGEFDNAEDLGEQLVSLDMLNESAWRTLMLVYAARGHRNHALMAYKRCCGILNKELGVEPSEETRELQGLIRGGSAGVQGRNADTQAMLTGESATAVPDVLFTPPDAVGKPSVEKPSIAVLPFVNMSDDPEQEYFSDGITEDIISGLSKFRELFVIARGSSFAFKGQSLSLTEAAAKLGARYVLEGSVRKGGDRVRITAQLSDATTGNHLWAEHYDRVIDDIFAAQDHVTQKIISTLVGRLEDESRQMAMKKSVTNLSAYDYFLRGKYFWPDWRGAKKNILRAREMFEKAMELDPGYASAYIGLTESYLSEFWSSWTRDRDVAGALTFEYASKAVELDNRDSHAHMLLGLAYYNVQRNFELAEVHTQMALDLNPNDYWNYCAKCELSMCSGDFAESMHWGNEAIHRNPFLPDSCLHVMGFTEYFAGRYENSIKTFAKLSAPEIEVKGCIAACYAQLGKDEEAATAAADFRRRASSELSNQANWDNNSWCDYWSRLFNFKDPEQLDHLTDGLRKAGLLD